MPNETRKHRSEPGCRGGCHRPFMRTDLLRMRLLDFGMAHAHATRGRIMRGENVPNESHGRVKE
jgi:hypothetical protein